MNLRDFYDDRLPAYEDIRNALANAVQETLDKDYDLIALGGHEQAIAHRIAVYLEKYFPSFHTDCEYNRNKHKAKNRRPETPGDKRQMRPDIIVHRRNTPDNVLAVEMKANANPESASDLDKLKCLKGERTYLYKGTAFICIHNALGEITEGVLSASVDWYDVDKNGITKRESETANMTCDKHAAQVKTIVKQRSEGE